MSDPITRADAPGRIPAGRIGGVAVASTDRHPVIDPATADEVATVDWATQKDADDAVACASDRMTAWTLAPRPEQAAALTAIATRLREDRQALAGLISLETGKRLAEADAEVTLSAGYFDWYARITPAPHELPEQATGALHHQVGHHPVGVVAAVTPWNFPLSIPARKLAPALAAGCAVVLKPSELTPLSAMRLVEICESELPAGLVNLVNGNSAAVGRTLIDHPGVACVTFTGSTNAGREIARRAGGRLARTVMELGGRAPFIICRDADIDHALDTLMVAKFRNNGASCIAANNIVVDRRIYPEVLDGLIERVRTLKVGNPVEPDTELGPLLRPSEVHRATDLLTAARAAGCRTWSGPCPPGAGFYLAPAVIEASRTGPWWTTEIFAPLCSVQPYDDEDQVVEMVNSWNSGLGGYIMSSDPDHAMRLARRLRIGILGINNATPNAPYVPFGGFGHSGLGREGGPEGLAAFTETQTIAYP